MSVGNIPNPHIMTVLDSENGPSLLSLLPSASAMIAARTGANILEFACKLVPIPYLDTSVSILQAICSSIHRVRGIRSQMTAMATSVGELLVELNTKLQGMSHLDPSIEEALHNFNSLLLDIRDTAHKYSQRSHLKIFFTPTDIQGLINDHQRQIAQVTSTFQTHIALVIHNDVRKFEEARKEDHRELLSAVNNLKNNKSEFTKAANEAMSDASPLTKKEVEDYLSVTGAGTKQSDEAILEHDIVDKMLRCLNRTSVMVPPQYQGSTSTGWSPQQYSPNHPQSYTYHDEPSGMSEHESQMPVNRAYPPRRPAYPPTTSPYPPYESPAQAPPYSARPWNSVNGHEQPAYNYQAPPSVGSVPFPVPHHYPTTG